LTRSARGFNWRSLILAAPVLLLGSCASVQEPSSDISTTADNSAKTYRLWEESTRDFADDLMEEAQRLQGEGRGNEAIAMADEALCVVLETPTGYSPEGRYLEYLAELIDEANEIESTRQLLDDDIDDAEEFVQLPPIDLLVVRLVGMRKTGDATRPATNADPAPNAVVQRALGKIEIGVELIVDPQLGGHRDLVIGDVGAVGQDVVARETVRTIKVEVCATPEGELLGGLDLTHLHEHLGDIDKFDPGQYGLRLGDL